MYVRNFLHAGDYIQLIPVGIPVTLVYNTDLEKVMLYYNDDKVDITDRVWSLFRTGNVAPLKIPIANGTTWVSGVLYTGAIDTTTSGKIPEDIVEPLLQKFCDYPDKFKFYACTVKSITTRFFGAASTRQWLSTSGFNLLPGMLVPSVKNKEQFYDAVNKINYPFLFPLVMGYAIFNKHQDGEIVSTSLKQFICTSVETRLTEDGYVNGVLRCNDGSEIVTSYTNVVNYNIRPMSLIVLDYYGAVIYCKNLKDTTKLSRQVVCPVCGKMYTVPNSGECICDDPECLSRAYTRIKRFTTVLNLPCMTHEMYLQQIKNRDITTFIDFLIEDPINNAKISATMDKLLFALTPEDVVSDISIFTQFASKCNNSWDVLQYYILNPERIAKEFLMPAPVSNKFVEYLQSKGIADDITIILGSPQIEFLASNRKFDGPPIFRDKTIMITGKFSHGDYNEISAILQSYGAKVVFSFDERIHLLLVGNISENINGKVIKNCKNLGIPIMEESKFFETYEIDKDLGENLQ